MEYSDPMRRVGAAAVLVALVASAAPAAEPDFPVAPELFIDAFQAAEGLTFNDRGQLFTGADQAIWIARPDGSVTRVTEVTTHLGQAGIGEGDILAADFGPSALLRHGPATDGIVWRISPEGDKSLAAVGIGDPNAILGLPDGSYLVSDDFTDNIYRIGADGVLTLFCDTVEHPNGMALSPDGATLYVAQIFESIAPVVFSDRLWAVPLTDGAPSGPPRLVAETGGGGLDGLAMDESGRVYIADNGGGRVWRFDPGSEELELIAEGVPHVASMVFGEGDFDRESLYATSTFRGGGRIWRIPVGARGARQHRVDPGLERSARFGGPSPVVLPMSGDFGTRPVLARGLEALYRGWFDEARATFREAQAADPSFALAYWGEAMSHFDPTRALADLVAGREAIDRMESSLSPDVEERLTAPERVLIDSARILFSDAPGTGRLHHYSDRLGEAHAELPFESEIAVAWAGSLLALAASRESQAPRLRAAAVLEDLLVAEPRQPAALHYLLHAYEGTGLGALRERIERRYAESLAARAEPAAAGHGH